MLFVPLIPDLDEKLCNGIWTRDQLLEMDSRFKAAVELAFARGSESRAATAATYTMNGKRRADEIAIELAWRWLRENMDASIDVSFVEVVAFVNARCPNVAASRVQAEFKKRFARDGSWKGVPMVTGERVKEQLEEELDAGRRTLARGQTSEFGEEVEAGRCRDDRVRARLELEQAAGRRTSAKFG